MRAIRGLVGSASSRRTTFILLALVTGGSFALVYLLLTFILPSSATRAA
jgi:phage shock protein PspC (stress-responsive transcriptional regulator)